VDANKQVSAFVKEVSRAHAGWHGLKLQDYPAGAAIAALSPQEQVQIVQAAVSQQVAASTARKHEVEFYLNALLGTLLKRKLPFESSNCDCFVHISRRRTWIGEDHVECSECR